MKILERILHRKRFYTEEARLTELARKAQVVQEAKGSDFYKLVLDEAARLHEKYLQASQNSPWCSGGAYSLLELTNTLESYVETRNKLILSERQRKDNEMRAKPRNGNNVYGVEDDMMVSSEPHTLE